MTTSSPVSRFGSDSTTMSMPDVLLVPCKENWVMLKVRVSTVSEKVSTKRLLFMFKSKSTSSGGVVS